MPVLLVREACDSHSKPLVENTATFSSNES